MSEIMFLLTWYFAADSKKLIENELRNKELNKEITNRNMSEAVKLRRCTASRTLARISPRTVEAHPSSRRG
jgi:hypothetical protein